MENFDELKSLMSAKSKTVDLIDCLRSIGWVGPHFETKFIGITESRNGQYTLGDIKRAIGEDKFKSILEQFEGLLAVELHKIKEKHEKELAAYTIVKAA